MYIAAFLKLINLLGVERQPVIQLTLKIRTDNDVEDISIGFLQKFAFFLDLWIWCKRGWKTELWFYTASELHPCVHSGFNYLVSVTADACGQDLQLTSVDLLRIHVHENIKISRFRIYRNCNFVVSLHLPYAFLGEPYIGSMLTI